MPKEYINWPQPVQVARALTKAEVKAGEDGIDVLPPGPRIGVHWDGVHGSVQLSIDIDWDVLQEMVKTRQNDPDGWYGEDDGNFPNRSTFYTNALDRADLQRLIKHVRRARDAAFGADE